MAREPVGDEVGDPVMLGRDGRGRIFEVAGGRRAVGHTDEIEPGERVWGIVWVVRVVGRHDSEIDKYADRCGLMLFDGVEIAWEDANASGVDGARVAQDDKDIVESIIPLCGASRG